MPYHSEPMHRDRSSTLKPAFGSTIWRPTSRPTVATAGRRVIRGKALIFWDPKLPGTRYGQKLDAIDTDQITPAADCVSESLETLDERWKAGSFRYLMPDFRARVHRGETFVIAGDRFAIGSSREMSPAGLKGVAEEAGLEMVIVCGDNMGDIFRRNALNLGLQVVAESRRRSPTRVTATSSHSIPSSRQLDQRHARQDVRPGAADAEGRRDSPERRHLHDRPPRVPRVGRTRAGHRVSGRGARAAR